MVGTFAVTVMILAQVIRPEDAYENVRFGGGAKTPGAVTCWDSFGRLVSTGCTGGGGGGEVNTASNLGSGASVFSTKVLVDLRFRSLVAATNRLSITQGTNEISFDIVPANITLSSLGGLLNMAQLNTTGTASSSTYLRGDGVWATVAGGGGGGPANTDALAEGTTNLYFTTSRARGAISSTGVITYNSSTGVVGCTTCVSTSSSYGDPAWISGLAWSKIVGAPAFEVSTNRGIANGYASLGATALVPAAQLGTGTANSTVFLRGDGTWTNPAGNVNLQVGGTSIGTRPGVNFIGGAGISITAADDSGNNRVNITPSLDTAVALTQATAQAGTPLLCTGSGTAGAQTCSMTPALGAYTTGQVIQYRPGTTNTTTQTVAINGLTAISILRHDGAALQAGDLTAGRQYPITYDGTAFRLPPAGGASLLPTLTEINNADYVDFGTASQFVLDTTVSGKVMMTGANAATSGWWHGRRRTVTAGAWSRVFAISWQVEGNGNGIGVFFTDGTAYENCYITAASGEARWASYWGANSGAFGADRLAASFNFRGPGNGNVVYVRLRDDGTTNRDCSYSSSPTGPWHLIYSIGRTNGFTASGFGFGVLTQGAVARQTSMLIHGVQ